MWDRTYKGMFRSLATQGNPVGVYLTLPSDECRDVTEAIKHRTINRNTFVIAVERDPQKAKTIARKLKQFRFSKVWISPKTRAPI